ncbi:hypothetical protein EKD04_000960 [Chloroflexales bacterium ZM16-3]|nr:hypothetical protein [Chloroflexales bacterium ZM16-3]
MSKEKTPKQAWICPSCGKQLSIEGDLLRCAEHGEFFRYGPRLLVRVPSKDAAAALMPWQTMQEKAVG